MLLADCEAVEEQSAQLSECTINQLNDQGMCEDHLDGPLLQELELNAASLPSGLAKRIRDALGRNRASACMFRARILRMESQLTTQTTGHSTECKPLKVCAARIAGLKMFA